MFQPTVLPNLAPQYVKKIYIACTDWQCSCTTSQKLVSSLKPSKSNKLKIQIRK